MGCKRGSFRLFAALSVAVFMLSDSVVAQALEDPGWGFTFQVPRGWKAKKQSSGALLATIASPI